jgi:hypothetical protein
MNVGLSEKVRKTAEEKHVIKAKKSGADRFTIGVLDMHHELRDAGFPPNHIRQICEALRSKIFLQRNGLKIIRTEGPPSLTSTTVVFHYAFEGMDLPSHALVKAQHQQPSVVKDPLLELRGLLKGAIREGAQAFVQELRRDRSQESA